MDLTSKFEHLMCIPQVPKKTTSKTLQKVVPYTHYTNNLQQLLMSIYKMLSTKQMNTLHSKKEDANLSH